MPHLDSDVVPLDWLKAIDATTLYREVTIRPGMCGHNYLLVAHIGDWTWDTVSRTFHLDAFRAVDAMGNPSYLSFFYFDIEGTADFHLRSPRFGDRLQVVSRCYSMGRNSVLTIHRLSPASARLPLSLSVEEAQFGRLDGALYVQNVNKWICRGGNNNRELYAAPPVGFSASSVERVAPEFSPKPTYDTARREGRFATPGQLETWGKWTIPYEVDVTSDLNGSGLLYFATYFSIIDRAIGIVWRKLGREQHSFFKRTIASKRVCFLGNADAGTMLTVRVTASLDRTTDQEVFDIQIVEEQTERLLALSSVRHV